jgi:hypothetical protein
VIPPALLRPLLLPLHAAPLLLVAVFSALMVVGVRAGLPGLPILLIVGSWFFKYAFLLLDHAAEGRPGAPVLAVEHVNPLGEARPLAYGLALAAAYAATEVLGHWTGSTIVAAIRIFGLLALPALLATHTITGSFAEALHPRAAADAARGLGPGYLLVLLVALGCAWLGEMIALDAGHLSLWLRIALLMLLWLQFFATLGGVIHARRLELGFDPEHSPERTRQRAMRERDRARDRFMDTVFAEFRSGSPRNAFETIRRRVEASEDRLEEYAWIHECVVRWPDSRLAIRVAQAWLPLLLAAGRTGEALKVTKASIEADAGFHPLAADDALRLARLARDGGDRPLARRLLAGFDSRYPDEESRRAALILAEQLDNRQ